MTVAFTLWINWIFFPLQILKVVSSNVKWNKFGGNQKENYNVHQFFEIRKSF